MGVLKIGSALIAEKPELMDNAIRWLQRECKATILHQQHNGQYLTLRMEGEEIPVGEVEFGITIRTIVKGVHSIIID